MVRLAVVMVPGELPGDSVPLTMRLPKVPLPPSVPLAPTMTLALDMSLFRLKTPSTLTVPAKFELPEKLQFEPASDAMFEKPENCAVRAEIEARGRGAAELQNAGAVADDVAIERAARQHRQHVVGAAELHRGAAGAGDAAIVDQRGGAARGRDAGHAADGGIASGRDEDVAGGGARGADAGARALHAGQHVDPEVAEAAALGEDAVAAGSRAVGDHIAFGAQRKRCRVGGVVDEKAAHADRGRAGRVGGHGPLADEVGASRPCYARTGGAAGHGNAGCRAVGCGGHIAVGADDVGVRVCETGGIAVALTEIPVAVLPAALAVAVTAPSAVSRSVARPDCEALMPKTVEAVSLIDVADTAPCRLKSTGTTPLKSALRDAPVTFAASPGPGDAGNRDRSVGVQRRRTVAG